MDETLERRWGPQITKRSHYRDPLLSGNGLAVSNSGLRGMILARGVPLPWTPRHWALPFVAVCATPPEVAAERGHIHRTVGDITALMLRQIRRWLPARAVTVLGDGNYGSIELGLVAHDTQITLITPLRLDAKLFALAPTHQPGQMGRPRVKGAALLKLTTVLADPTTQWTTVQVR